MTSLVNTLYIVVEQKKGDSKTNRKWRSSTNVRKSLILFMNENQNSWITKTDEKTIKILRTNNRRHTHDTSVHIEMLIEHTTQS